MIFETLQTIGSLLSGLSIFTAFIMYKKEKYDTHMKEIKESISNMCMVVDECYALQNEYIYSHIENYLAAEYIKIYVEDLCKYAQSTGNITLENLKKYASDSINELNCFRSFSFGKSNVYNIYKQNNEKLSTAIIYNLAEIPVLTFLLKNLKNTIDATYTFINDIIANQSTLFEIICEIIIKNKMSVSNSELIMQKIKMRYIEYVDAEYENKKDSFNTIYQLCNYVLRAFFLLDNHTISKYIRVLSTNKSKDNSNMCIKAIIQATPDYILSDQDKFKCGQIIGEKKI